MWCFLLIVKQQLWNCHFLTIYYNMVMALCNSHGCCSDSKRYGGESSTYSFFLTQQILIVQTSVTIPLHWMFFKCGYYKCSHIFRKLKPMTWMRPLWLNTSTKFCVRLCCEQLFWFSLVTCLFWVSFFVLFLQLSHMFPCLLSLYFFKFCKIHSIPLFCVSIYSYVF